jgi:hypothetical protein
MNSSRLESIAVLAAVLIAAMSIFQILLAVGLPLGHAAFGGENRVLSKRLRCVGAINVLVFFVAFDIVLARSGLLGGVSQSSSLARIGTWVLVGVFGLSTLANVASRSRWERRLMAPVGLVLAVCCLTVALG